MPDVRQQAGLLAMQPTTVLFIVSVVLSAFGSTAVFAQSPPPTDDDCWLVVSTGYVEFLSGSATPCPLDEALLERPGPFRTPGLRAELIGLVGPDDDSDLVVQERLFVVHSALLATASPNTEVVIRSWRQESQVATGRVLVRVLVPTYRSSRR